MVYAELNHNPYLLTTDVQFNGQKPRINSLIEKYDRMPLKDWVTKVPQIFHDEMNGYDFDLYIIGTESDYNEIKEAFANAGVSDLDVRIILKNELEEPAVKSDEIDALLEWLKATPNRKFDFAQFWEEHSEFFESEYPYVIVRGEATDLQEKAISPEVVSSVQELSTANLHSIPVLMYIDEKSRSEVRRDLMELLDRSDVKQEQIFFMLHPAMNQAQVTRVLTDLGMEVPQIVKHYDDENVMQYFRNYPMTEYVREAIRILRSEVTELDAVLEEENRISAISNASIHAEISDIEDDIERLKTADFYMTEHNNYIASDQFQYIRSDLNDQILKWKNRKIKTTKRQEAEALASEFVEYLDKTLNNTDDLIRQKAQEIGTDYYEEFESVYYQAGLDSDYKPDTILENVETHIILPEMRDEFLKLMEVSEEAKVDILGLFRKSQSAENSEPVRVETFYLDRWREYAQDAIIPIVEEYIRKWDRSLEKYMIRLTEEYHDHLQILIADKITDKNTVSEKLSDDEKRLQVDNDWLSAFKDQLNHVERG